MPTIDERIEAARKLEGYTPGPWRVGIDDDGNPLSGRPGVFSSDELDCGIVHWDGFVQEYWRSARGDKEIHANARIIAAAPDTLALALDLAAERERLREALIRTAASLVAAISLLERGGKKAAASDTMFAAMLKDYQASVDKARAAW